MCLFVLKPVKSLNTYYNLLCDATWTLPSRSEVLTFFICRKEMDRIVKALFHLLRKEDNPQHESEGALAKMAFKEMDENNDDKITEAEFVKACLSQEKISSMLALRLVDVFI